MLSACTGTRVYQCVLPSRQTQGIPQCHATKIYMYISIWLFLHPMIAIGFLILGAFALSFAGILAGIWANKFDELAAITNFVIQPLTFLSGTFYSVDRLPAPFDMIASLNPVFYAIDGFRYGMIGVADRPLMTGFYCLVAVNVVLAILCYKALRSGYRLKS